MMSDLWTQLQEWSLSGRRLDLTPEILARLGPFTDEAKQSQRLVDAFIFTYRVDGADVTGFLVVPKKREHPLPIIIFNRGGTGDFGLVPRGHYFTRIARMARWGYVVMGSYYPGNSYSDGKDEHGGSSDIASVLRLHDLIEALSDADESRIGMYGESRGGMMTYLCMKEVSWIKAASTVGGLTNLDRLLSLRPEMRTIFEDSFGNTRHGILDRSAVHWTAEMNKDTPLCLLHGGDDDKVSPLDALELATNLQRTRHPYSLHVIEGGNHGLTNYIDQRNDLVRNWFDRFLRPPDENTTKPPD